MKTQTINPSFRGASEAREPGIHIHYRFSWAPPHDFCRVRDYGFRARRFAAPRNDGKSELRGELIQAHDVGEIAHLVFLLGIEAHDQRDGRGFEIAHVDAVGIG
jgi:hypothetical protein